MGSFPSWNEGMLKNPKALLVWSYVWMCLLSVESKKLKCSDLRYAHEVDVGLAYIRTLTPYISLDSSYFNSYEHELYI